MLRQNIIPTLPCLLLLAACNQPFDPRAPLKEQLVVFSILSTDRDVQFVRVQTTYMPPDFDPLTHVSENPVTDAVVNIRGPSASYVLRDTILARQNTSRYKFPMHAYVLKPFVPQRGLWYDVIVQSPTFGTAFATVVVPEKTAISISAVGQSTLYFPDRHGPDAIIQYQANVSHYAKGYVGRLFIDYDVLKGTQWVEERIEVPIVSGAGEEKRYTLEAAVYPRLTPKPSTTQTGFVFRNGYYNAMVNHLRSTVYPQRRITFNRVVFQLLQVEENLYLYYNLVGAYEDPRSIRLDAPSHSNIDGGIGLVGAYSLDSLVQILPENFIGNQ